MSDPFESSHFDPIQYLNEKFPDQDSLANLDTEIDKLNQELASVNKELIQEIHQHAMMNIEISEEIQKAKTLSKEIIEEIGIIKEKAKKSEEIVYDMCKDLKSLDIAKRNLTFSIDALKKFIMMVDALEKLRNSCENKSYAEVNNLLSAFLELSKHFKKYENIQQIQDLYKEKNAIVEELYQQIIEDFAEYQSGQSKLDSKNMHHATQVIEVLGEKYWRKFAQNINSIMLKQYQEQYGNNQSFILQNTEKRFGLIKRKMQDFNQKFDKIIPIEWGMDCLLLYEFCSITRLHITKTLEKTANSVNVAVLMKSLQFSLKFENKITDLMQKKYGQLVKRQDKKKNDLHSLPKFTGSISNSFEPYLNPYIKSQEEALCDALLKSLDDDKLSELESKVFNSAIVLFHGVKNSIRRASNYSKGNLLLEILKIVKKIFKIYSEKCFEKARKPGEGIGFEENICFIINTGEYCKNIIEGVREVFELAIDAGFAENIQFSDQQHLFSNLISKAIEYLIGTLEQKIQQSFGQISKMNWDKIEEMGDMSFFVREVKEYLKSNFMKIKDEMTSIYLTLYMDKIVVLVANKFIQNIYKCKKLPSTAYQILRMDIIEIKETFLSLVKADQKTYTIPKTMQKYITFVNKSFFKGENIIRVMELTNDQFAERFQMLIEGATLQELEKILQVRGAKKTDFPALVKSIESKNI